MNRLFSIILILISSGGSLTAQSTAPNQSPEAVTRAFYEAMIRRDWVAATRLVDPADLARNKVMFRPVFEADTSRFLMLRVLNDTTRRRFDEIPDLDFNARLFEFATGVSSQGSAFDRFQGIDIFAVAKPAEDHAFVVYQWRLPAGERPIRGRLVTELRKLNGEWRMVMLGDYTNLKELLEQR